MYINKQEEAREQDQRQQQQGRKSASSFCEHSANVDKFKTKVKKNNFNFNNQFKQMDRNNSITTLLSSVNEEKKKSSYKQVRQRNYNCTHHFLHHLSLFLFTSFLASILTSSTSEAQSNTPLYQQHNNILHFSVLEGLPNGTSVGIIKSSDGQIPFVVMPTSQTPESERLAALNINLETGEMTTNSVLNREEREQYHFIAIARNFAEIKCTVTVKDINDNAPMFLLPNNETNFVIDIPEGQKGLRKVLPLAFDLDTSQFGIKEFRMVSGNTPFGMFTLVEHGAPAGSGLLSSQLANSDVDSSTSILAGDNPQLQQQLAREATVLIPSQPVIPQPVSSSTSSLVATTSSSQQALLTSSSSSSSSSSSQTPPQSLSSSSSKFLVDLEVSKALDRENQSSYMLEIEAIDGGQPPLLGRLMVTVNVQDVNDNEPVFTQTLYEQHSREDTSKGTILLRVQAHDIDLDSNGQISYFIRSHSSSSSSSKTTLFNSNSSDKTAESTPSSSTNSRYGTNKRISTNISTLKSPPPTTSVGGGGGVGGASVVGGATGGVASNNNNKLLIGNSNTQRQQQQLQGTNEIYDNSNYNFKTKLPSSHSSNINNNNNNDFIFEIDEFNGEIKLNHQLDYEIDQWHNLTIEARDHGKPSRSGFAQVIINVINIDDDPPSSSAAPSSSHNGGRFISSNDERLKSSSSNLIGGGITSNEQSRPAELFSIPKDNSHYSSTQSYFQNLINSNLFGNLFDQTNNNSILFVFVLAIVLVGSIVVCLVKTKSRQSDDTDCDFNDDQAGLTLTSNNGQSKLSPNHSIDDDHSNNSSSNNDQNHLGHHRSHHVDMVGKSSRHNVVKPLYDPRYIDTSNVYLNLMSAQQIRSHQHATNSHHPLQQPSSNGGCSPSNHQVATNCGSAGGTMTSHNNATIIFPPNTPQPYDNRWMSSFDHATSGGGGGGVASANVNSCSQLVNAQDWYGSYEWDYLSDWAPEYHTIMPLIQNNFSTTTKHPHVSK